MVGPRDAVWIYKSLVNSHLNKVGWFLIVLLAEGNNLAHGDVIPVGKWTYDMRNLATFNRLKVRVDISHAIYLIPVVLSEVGIFDL